jgi:hypothetical protein
MLIDPGPEVKGAERPRLPPPLVQAFPGAELDPLKVGPDAKYDWIAMQLIRQSSGRGALGDVTRSVRLSGLHGVGSSLTVERGELHFARIQKVQQNFGVLALD